MKGLFIRTAIRNLLRHKLQSLVGIASLAIGLSVFAFAFLYVKQELSYDRGWPDSARVHRLLTEQRGLPGLTDGTYNLVSARLWPRITDYFADSIDAATRVTTGFLQLKDAGTTAYTTVSFVDAQFLDIFQLERVDGDLARVLSGPGFLAIEESVAERLGFTGHVGERFAFVSNYGGEIEFELAAIYRLPRPVTTATQVPAFTLIHDYARPMFVRGDRSFIPWEVSSSVWLKLKPGVETDAFNAQQAAFVQQEITTFDAALGPERRVSDHVFHRWQRLADIHFNPLANEAGLGRGDPARVATFAIVGLLVLFVGCSNAVSLSLAAALERRREIGVRKAAGALPGDIARQQLGESSLMALLALVPAIAVLELLLPPFQALMPTVRVDAGWPDYLVLAAIAALVGLACGAYPALVLAATRPQTVLRAGAQERVKHRLGLRGLLVATQFCFASMLLIGTAALYLQLATARAQPLGFDVDNVVMLFQTGQRSVSISAYTNELGAIPGVVEVIRASNPPNSNMPLTFNMMTLVRDGGASIEVEAQVERVDFGFIDFMRIPLLAGRNFDAQRDVFSPREAQYSDGQGSERAMLNVTAARQLGFPAPNDAIEQTVYRRSVNTQTGEVGHTPIRIIGVIADNLYGSLRRLPVAQIYVPVPAAGVADATGNGNYMLRYEDAVADSIQQRIDEVSARVTGSAVALQFVEPQLDAAFLQEQNESKLLLICGGLALVLASFGLYGLAAFALERQIKEVGVRKAMGASVAAIVGLYLWRFARPVIVANLLAWPVASYFVMQWIERFPYQMERAWLVPLGMATLAAVLTIAMLTVGVITLRAARANPLRSLRYE